MTNLLGKAVRRIDGFQQKRPPFAFIFAVVKKFGDDQAGNLAALVAYYGFFSLFPLLMVARLYLGVHWWTDVVGGMGLGGAWLCLLVAIGVWTPADTRPPHRS